MLKKNRSQTLKKLQKMNVNDSVFIGNASNTAKQKLMVEFVKYS